MNPQVYTIEQIKDRIEPVVRSTPVRKVILSGSYARGKASRLSDIDLLIDSGGALCGYSFFGLYDRLEKQLRKSVDLIDKVDLEEESALYREISSNGVIIYEQVQE